MKYIVTVFCHVYYILHIQDEGFPLKLVHKMLSNHCHEPGSKQTHNIFVKTVFP